MATRLGGGDDGDVGEGAEPDVGLGVEVDVDVDVSVMFGSSEGVLLERAGVVIGLSGGLPPLDDRVP